MHVVIIAQKKTARISGYHNESHNANANAAINTIKNSSFRLMIELFFSFYCLDVITYNEAQKKINLSA